jgi:hypothetical protein
MPAPKRCSGVAGEKSSPLSWSKTSTVPPNRSSGNCEVRLKLLNRKRHRQDDVRGLIRRLTEIVQRHGSEDWSCRSSGTFSMMPSNLIRLARQVPVGRTVRRPGRRRQVATRSSKLVAQLTRSHATETEGAAGFERRMASSPANGTGPLAGRIGSQDPHSPEHPGLLGTHREAPWPGGQSSSVGRTRHFGEHIIACSKAELLRAQAAILA